MWEKIDGNRKIQFNVNENITIDDIFNVKESSINNY